jgi:2-polyprenyl-3-methyl-5-hydroxy-6-metoxy-1,4-benzoquinol methylase
MDSKATFEKIYSVEDPWRYKNTISDRTRRRILLKHIDFIFADGSRKDVLDAGCGEGYLTRDVASTYNAAIDAFDISENALAIARKRNSHPNINYFQLDLNEFSPEKKYDLILCEEALYYLGKEERIRTVNRFREALKDGGHLRLTAIIIGETPDGKFFTPDTVREVMAKSGLQLVSIWPSVIRKNLFEKVFYRLLEYGNKIRPAGSGVIEFFTNRTLHRPLDRCRAISLLAKKV